MARDRYPYLPFYMTDFRHSRAVQAMTWEQRGRYVWAWEDSWRSETPGVATEDEWRTWLGYSPKKWKKTREIFAKCFRIENENVWIQERLREEWELIAIKRMRLSDNGKRGNESRWRDTG